jgi:response regulator of citrate/malate metabolism
MHRTLERLRAEFLEMPGLQLSAAQVARLCGVEQTICRAVLDALVDAKFLRVSEDGQYARLTEGDVPRPRPAKATRTWSSRQASQKHG